ncbi:hypothetical protein TNCV_5032101 [Trichonephila clavipes]|nr:hypothetical protein TNCV_5032101 [Trichonephila clavipes]
MSRLKHSPVGVVWKLGQRLPAQVSSLSHDYGSKRRGPSPIALMKLCSATEFLRFVAKEEASAGLNQYRVRETFIFITYQAHSNRLDVSDNRRNFPDPGQADF